MSKSKETATENVEVLATYKENMMRTIEEISKYWLSVQINFKLTTEYLQTIKETIIGICNSKVMVWKRKQYLCRQ